MLSIGWGGHCVWITYVLVALDSLLVARGECPNAASLQGSGVPHVITQLTRTWGVFFSLQEGMQVT